jgi:hypothetical protein
MFLFTLEFLSGDSVLIAEVFINAIKKHPEYVNTLNILHIIFKLIQLRPPSVLISFLGGGWGIGFLLQGMNYR